jgi:hypothetical protein
MPMLSLLEEASKNIFIPLTVGGGIRSYTDPLTQQSWTALEVASRYFRAGADKVRKYISLLFFYHSNYSNMGICLNSRNVPTFLLLCSSTHTG